MENWQVALVTVCFTTAFWAFLFTALLIRQDRAYAKRLRELEKRPIGRLLDMREDEKGLVVKGQLFEGVVIPKDNFGQYSIDVEGTVQPKENS